MESYSQRFFVLLLPISTISIFFSLIYFKSKYDYGLAQTLPLSMITGFMIGATLTFFASFFFLLPTKTFQVVLLCLVKRKI